MELLQAEINRKRKISSALIDELNPNQKGQLGTASGGSGHTHTRTRYYRQGDLKNLEEKKLRENQYKKDQEKLQQIQKNYQIQEAENARVEEETASDKAKIFENLLKLDMKSIQNRLRNLMQPVTLFGESNEERIHRLCTVMSDEGEGDDYRLAASYSTNGNQKTKEKRNRNGEEEDDMYEDDEGSGQLNDQLKDENKSNSKDDNEEGDDAEHQQEGRQSSFKKGEIATHYSTTPGLTNQKIIYKYFRNLLKQWEWDLDDRDDMTKRTAKGKMETRTQKQCKDYIRPLFKLCKNDEIPWDISDKLVKIVAACENGDFRSAHDQYLQAAIGKAAWPIGLTMVGIHERSGREKISTSKVAHVMNNELQRKYFTSVKRLMTYAQTKRSDVAPSMKSL